MAMQNLELSRDLRELLKCFLSHDVRFLIIGGHAVSYHGYSRFTKDLGICRPLKNGKSMIQSHVPNGSKHRMDCSTAYVACGI